MSRFVIDDKMWNKLEQLLPSPKGRHGENDRLFIEAVCWIIRTGAPWRDFLEFFKSRGLLGGGFI
ncbi:transposase [Legionella sp. 27cVA30]|uniref:transposase n=1 Tax=Legionella sp. 27cVA30 TaxID=2905657 RepID=UPI00353253B9